MSNGRVINDLVRGVDSCNSFYIMPVDETRHLAEKLSHILLEQGISSKVIADVVKDNFNQDDCILVISKSGRQDDIVGMVKTALKKNVKVYVISGDFRSPLALLAHGCIVIDDKDDFKQITLKYFEWISEIISYEKDSIEADYKLNMSFKDMMLSPMQGMVIRVNVEEGDMVMKGDVIFVIEAIKMENELESQIEGLVRKVMVGSGDIVHAGDPIIIIK